MNLIACNNCGVVHDKDKVKWPSDEEVKLPGGGLDPGKTVWVSRDPYKTAPCGVCGGKLQGDMI
jgi:hypothetical protein